MIRRPPTRIELRPEDKEEYEEARKAHIRKLQADLARGSTENLVQNSFQFNPDGKDDKSKEERIGLGK